MGYETRALQKKKTATMLMRTQCIPYLGGGRARGVAPSPCNGCRPSQKEMLHASTRLGHSENYRQMSAGRSLVLDVFLVNGIPDGESTNTRLWGF